MNKCEDSGHDFKMLAIINKPDYSIVKLQCSKCDVIVKSLDDFSETVREGNEGL